MQKQVCLSFLLFVSKFLTWSVRHLIADHLGWFEDSTGEGKLRTIEDIMRAKGESVRRGITNENGDIEFVEP